MYRTTSVMALGLFLGLAPVGLLAQTQTYEPETQQQTTEPTAPQTQQQTTEPAMPESEAQPEVAATDGDEPTGDVIPVQDAEAMLASSLMGASVNLADESIGKVSDLIIGPDYSLQGVLVGVGGFRTFCLRRRGPGIEKKRLDLL